MMANNIENNIKLLKQQVKSYEELSDYEKIMSEEYGNIIDEKEACAFTLNEYKNTFANINNCTENKGNLCDDETFRDIMKKTNIIKQNINENKNLDELMQMYNEICTYKQSLRTYFDGKKMEVVNM
jgi:hypothetical protein